MVERGTHVDLLIGGGRYQELYRTQFDQPTTTEPVEAIEVIEPVS